MGVAHLINHLRPYGVVNDLTGEDVVIDGPSLTYHVYHICCASQPQARNPFEAIPSYAFLSETVLNWLNELGNHGVVVKKIYFDGFLPASKQDVRSSRLMNYTKQLNNYHDSWPQLIPQLQKVASPLKPMLFDLNVGPSSASQLPAAPFIVPAVIEALKRSSTYGPITEVVPNEADLFCASYVRLNSGTVLTSDSDLLIHDLGRGSVTFLKDIEYSESENRLKSTRYEMANITTRLGLHARGVRDLAFEIKISPSRGFSQLLQRAAISASVTNHEALYQDFVLQYEPMELTAGKNLICPVIKDIKIEGVLKSLDPRISEYVQQYASKLSNFTPDLSSTNPDRDDQRAIDVYLPFLLDCPSRGSAWEISTSVRQLAYGLMNLLLPPAQHILSIIEHRRQQSLTQGREWQLPRIEEIPAACEDIADLIEKFHNGLNDIPVIDRWHGITLYQDLVHALSMEKPSLSQVLILRSSNAANTQTRISWDTTHFSSQMQASYYSFRMLKQILGVVIVAIKSTQSAPYLNRLQQSLENLPQLKELRDLHTELTQIGGRSTVTGLKFAQSLLPVNNFAPSAPEKEKQTKEKRKKKRKASRVTNSTNTTEALSNNLYNILNID